MRSNYAWILEPKNGGAYAYIFDSLEKAQKKNKQMKGRLDITKVRLIRLWHEKNTITKEE